MIARFLFILIVFGACSCSQESWEQGDSIVAVEFNSSSREAKVQSVMVVYKKKDGTLYRKVSAKTVTDGSVTVNPKDYVDGKIPYGPISHKP